MGRVNNRESLYSVVTTVLLANISYVPFVRLPVFWKSSFREWFPVSVLCCVQKHGAVRSGNRKRCRRRHKTDWVVLGNSTQDSRCRYFCIIAGQTGFSLRFLLKKMEDRVAARIPIRTYFRYFSYRPSIKEIPWKAELYHSRIDWVVWRQEVIGFPEPALTWYIIIKKRVRFKCRLA